MLRSGECFAHRTGAAILTALTQSPNKLKAATRADRHLMYLEGEKERDVI